MSILNVDVSEFESVKKIKNPNRVNLLEWLSDDSKKKLVNAVRNNSSAKTDLPCITPSGVFSQRSEKGLVEHSSLIAFDVDEKDNHLSMTQIRKKVIGIPYIAYLSKSCSGKGLWGLIPIRYPKYHKQHFNAIEQSFRLMGVIIDKAPSNVSSLRFCSYDAKPYFNHNAKIFNSVLLDDQTSMKGGNSTTIEKIENCIDQVIKNQIDITEGYEIWRNIGFALVSEFGSSGREYFHQLSQFYHSYNFDEADEQYTKCLNSTGSGITISTLFSYLKDYGILFKSGYKTPRKK